MIFEVPGGGFEGPNRSKIGPKIVLPLSGSKNGSWRPLGTLLEASWSQQEGLGAPRSRLETILET